MIDEEGVNTNPRRGFCDWRYDGGGFCQSIGSIAQGGLGSDRWFCRGHVDGDSEHIGQPMDRKDWRTEYVRTFRGESPQYERQADEGGREYGHRMIQAIRAQVGSVASALKSPAQPKSADEDARKSSVDTARKALGDAALHEDLGW